MIQYTQKSFLICQKDYMFLYDLKIINSVLKVSIVAHNARHYYLIFLLKKKETYKEKNKTMRNLAIAVTQTLVTCINYIHHYCERIFGITPLFCIVFCIAFCIVFRAKDRKSVV